MSNETISRENLYELVWSESLVSLSKKYNISDVGLRKICMKMNVPVPYLGYWQKKQYGKPLQKTPLPKKHTGIQEISLSLRSDEDKEKKQISPLSDLKRIEKEITEKIRITIPATLHSKNPLIQSTIEYFSSEKSWNYKKPHLNINVSKNLEKRALRFMIAFINAMEERGHHVIVENENTIAVVLEEKLIFKMREKSTRILHKEEKYSWQRQELIPNGKLSFQYYSYYTEKEWVDSDLLIEDKITHIIAYFEVKAIKEKQERKEREERQRKYEDEQRKIREFQERKAKELSDFKTMFVLSNRYQKAIELRNYIEAVISHSLKNGSISKDLEIWIEWAKKKADWFDPFINAPDEYLNDTDKNKIDVS